MFRYQKVEFVTSCALSSTLFASEMPEIAVVGKSNVGKSSFINMLADNKKLARTSNTPGRTRLINYFRFEDRFMLVDLPGYGYAQVAKSEKEKWGEMIEGYLTSSPYLKRIILLLDSRHQPTADDIQMVNYMYQMTLPFTVVLTKTDKLTRNQLNKNRRDIARAVRLTENDVYSVSAEDKSGRDEVISLLNQIAE